MARVGTIKRRVIGVLADRDLPAPMAVTRWVLVLVVVLVPAGIAAAAVRQGSSPEGAQAIAHVDGPNRVARRRHKQARPRTEVKIDPALLDRYVGTYQLGPYGILTITRDGNRLFEQLDGQPSLEIFPQGDQSLFIRIVPAQFTVLADGQDDATAVVLHQNGLDVTAVRIDKAEAAGVVATLARRTHDDSPMANSEAALRQQIEANGRGVWDPGQMSPALAAEARSQQPLMSGLRADLGAFEGLSFEKVGEDGSDVCVARYRNGEATWRISLAPDGTIIGPLVSRAS